MFNGTAILLLGVIIGIALTAGSIMFFHYVVEAKTTLDQIAQSINVVSSYYSNVKDSLNQQFDYVSQRLSRIEKKVDDLKPAEPEIKHDPGDIGNRSV